MSVERLIVPPSEAPARLASRRASWPALAALRRILGASLQAVLLTGIFLIPSFLTHFGLGLIAPLSAGYMTGRLRRLSLGEAAAVGLILGLCVWIPLPLAQREFGFLSQLSSVAVIFLSGVVAVYYGALIGITAWYGGYLVRQEASEDDDGGMAETR